MDGLQQQKLQLACNWLFRIEIYEVDIWRDTFKAAVDDRIVYNVLN